MSNRFYQTGRAVSFLVACFCGILLVGCEQTTVTPLIRATDTLTRPDRLLVYDFAVTPAEFDLDRTLKSPSSATDASSRQTEHEIQVGQAIAKAITDRVIRELRDRGIQAYRAADSSPPGEHTASIKGRFLYIDQAGRRVSGFRLGSGQLRTHIWMFQGSGLTLSLVAESEIATVTASKPATESAAGAAVAKPVTIETDAAPVAAEVAARIVDYCKRRGWIE